MGRRANREANSPARKRTIRSITPGEPDTPQAPVPLLAPLLHLQRPAPLQRGRTLASRGDGHHPEPPAQDDRHAIPDHDIGLHFSFCDLRNTATLRGDAFCDRRIVLNEKDAWFSPAEARLRFAKI